ncbi:SDR family oxidoreductase [Nocardioides sp. AE5]|uniref:SDR family NAD(P)-dependent oxidoreductase n=1 Tax=Nocardioides sp. AE5 TaxID=2962573 RepID=UPI002881037C|nr:SDR family oxidoreductase [Nocardioides sp. AE5]MDT0202153.1 SDR family oxidoreductase [Nocardioides sp. AE5]
MSTGERRVCVITGAGGRLGSAFCQAHARDYDIVAVCRTRVPAAPSQHESFIDPLDPGADVNPGRVFLVHADLEQPGQVEHVVDLVLARHGRVDLLVNNAAYSAWHPSGLVDGDAAMDDMARHFAVNVELPLRLAARFAQRFWTSRALENRAVNRNVVNVSSLAGRGVFPGGQGVYAASKAAQDHLTRHMAREFDSFGVRVNGLAPNAFPSIVPTETVVEGVVKLDMAPVTGKILTLDAERPQAGGSTAPADS